MIFYKFICILHYLRVYYELTKWPARSWLDSSVAWTLHQYRRGHWFESLSGLKFFSGCLSFVFNCDDQSCLWFSPMRQDLLDVKIAQWVCQFQVSVTFCFNFETSLHGKLYSWKWIWLAGMKLTVWIKYICIWMASFARNWSKLVTWLNMILKLRIMRVMLPNS